MDETALLDTLVKLASAGTSGVCILAIFWTGICLQRLPSDAPIERHRSLRYFMAMGVLIAFVSAAAACVSSYFNYRYIVQLKGENKALAKQEREVAQELDLSQAKVTDLEEQRHTLNERYVATAAELEESRGELASLGRQSSALETELAGKIAEFATLERKYSVLEREHKTLLDAWKKMPRR
ncbi:hypothetical protein ACFL09_01850 [Planctomycetota bacterium]